jgi:putative Mg2+ transporter-C (MgtC) family protein
MNSSLSFSEMALRLFAATMAGALIGIERESHGRPAGLRTTILTCTASAIAMILSEALFTASATAGGNWRPDPARLGAGILTGIGFLGGGAILRHDNLISGVTTAASLWFVTVLGLAFGSGLFLPATAGLVIALMTLVVLPTFEKFIPSDWDATVTVTLELEAMTEQQLEQRLRGIGLKVNRVDLDYDFVSRRKTITCRLKLKRNAALELSARTIAELRQCPGVLQAKWE